MKVFKKLVIFIVLVAIASTIAVPTFAAEKKKKMVYFDANEMTLEYYLSHSVSRKINPYTSKPYLDIAYPESSVSAMAVRYVTYLKLHYAFKGVIKGKSFYPYKKIKRKEFLKILINLYGKKNVPVTVADKKKANKSISIQWACKKLVSVAKKLGVSLKFDSSNKKKVTRLAAANMIEEFCTFHKRLRPQA